MGLSLAQLNRILSNIDDVSKSRNLDAFGRARVSDTGQRIDVEFLYDKQKDFFDEVTNNGAVTHNTVTRDLTLSLTNSDNGSTAGMFSHPVPYTPGNSQLQDITGTLNNASIGGGHAEVFLRSSISGTPTDIFVNKQSDWESWSTGIDWTNSHIFSIDFQSLKVGTVKYHLVENGEDKIIARLHNSNIRQSGYWQQPNLPVFWRIYNADGKTYTEMGYGDENNAMGIRYVITANALATMRAICVTVKSEGGQDLFNMPGLPAGSDMGISEKIVGSTLIPLISIRPKATFNGIPNLILGFVKSYTVQTNNAILIKPIIGGTLTNASWVDAQAGENMMEVDVAATAITGGKHLPSKYLYASSTGPASTRFAAAGNSVLGKSLLWYRKGSQSGILSLCAIRTGAADANCLASIDWEEVGR